MESHDSYPVFHSRLCKTQRRRLTKPDGSDAGWLIVNAADQFAEATTELASDLAAALDDATTSPDAPGDDPPQLAIPHPR